MLIALYLAAIVAANLSIAHFGPAAAPFNAFFLIGLNLASRDKLHDAWGRNVGRNMAALIAVGGLLSYALNAGAGRIALASVAAFAISEALDAAVYHVNRRRPYLIRSNVSNVFGAAADSAVFGVLAFAGVLPVPALAGIIAAQFAAKVAGGAVWAYLLHASKAVRRAGP